MITTVIICVISLLHSTVSITLETKQGSILGHTEKARNGDEFNAFRGIPFALPPTGSRRFRRPEPSKPWSGILDATKYANECLQNPDLDVTSTHGDEDCLYLNVFTKATSDLDRDLLPVVVFIHGGAFMFGGASLYEPNYFMEEEIVFVTFQYRLNLFGFLSTEEESLPGNYAMWDQIEALKWVMTILRTLEAIRKKSR